MRPIAITVALMFSVSTPAAEPGGPTPAAMALASELMRTTRLDDTMDQFTATLSAQTYEGLFRSLMSDPKARALLMANPQMPARLSKITTEQIRGMMTRLKPQLTTRLPALYATVYSEQEMRDIIAFYKTPSGQSLITKMPNVMVQSQKLSADFLASEMPTLMPALQAAINAELTTLQSPTKK